MRVYACVCVCARSSCEIGFFLFVLRRIYFFSLVLFIYIYVFGLLSPPSPCRVRI